MAVWFIFTSIACAEQGVIFWYLYRVSPVRIQCGKLWGYWWVKILLVSQEPRSKIAKSSNLFKNWIKFFWGPDRIQVRVAATIWVFKYWFVTLILCVSTWTRKQRPAAWKYFAKTDNSVIHWELRAYIFETIIFWRCALNQTQLIHFYSTVAVSTSPWHSIKNLVALWKFDSVQVFLAVTVAPCCGHNWHGSFLISHGYLL